MEKPAVIVLLDSDDEGSEAKRAILRGGQAEELLKPRYILQVGELSSDLRGPVTPTLVETEDLIPLAICADAVGRYVREMCAAESGMAERVTLEAIAAEAPDGKGVFKSIQKCLTAIDGELHIEKIGFARAVIESVIEFARVAPNDANAAAALREFEKNMKTLFRRLRQMQREAERELISDRVSARVNRAKSSFFQDHPSNAKREHVLVLFEEFESALDNSEEADAIRREIQSLQRDFKINDDLTEPVEDYGAFRERLERVRYAGRLATQEPTLQEASIEAAGRTAAALRAAEK